MDFYFAYRSGLEHLLFFKVLLKQKNKHGDINQFLKTS